MIHRTPSEVSAMSYADYKVDVWKRLADGWRSFLGSPNQDQDYVRHKIEHCSGMAARFAFLLKGQNT